MHSPVSQLRYSAATTYGMHLNNKYLFSLYGPHKQIFLSL